MWGSGPLKSINQVGIYGAEKLRQGMQENWQCAEPGSNREAAAQAGSAFLQDFYGSKAI
jgi:hypothetical protein